MTTEPLDRNLAQLLKEEPETLDPRREFREALLARAKEEIARGRKRPGGRVMYLFLGAAAAAILLVAVLLSAPPDPAGTDQETAFAGRLGDARAVPDFRSMPMASRLYDDPVDYLRRHKVDASLRGLVDFYLRLARGEKSQIEMAKFATLDALSRRAGTAFAPLLTALYDRDRHEGTRVHILRFLKNRRDRVVLPWLDARLMDCSPKLLTKVAAARAAMGVPGKKAARALRQRATELGILDPGSGKYERSSAPAFVKAIAAIEGAGGEQAGSIAERLLAEKPTVDLLVAAYEALADREAPEVYGKALDRLFASAMRKDDASFDDVALLDLLAMSGDERFIDLLERVLADSYVALAIEGARIAGAWRVAAAVPLLRETAMRARRMGEDGQDLQPPVLWALARCGERDAIAALKSFLETMDWYRAGEWAIDALMDLDVPAKEILLSLPNETYAVGKLPAITGEMSGADRAALDTKARSLPKGTLRSALELLRDTGVSRDARTYVGSVISGGGNIGLYLTFLDPEKVRATLGSKRSEHDKVRAVKAIRILQVDHDARMEIAGEALNDRGGGVRIEAAKYLGWVGGEQAAGHLATALKKERNEKVAEQIARTLNALKPEPAAEALAGAFEDPKALLAVPEAALPLTLGILSRGKGSDPRIGALLEAVFEGTAGKNEVLHLAAARALPDSEPATTALIQAAGSEALLTRVLALEALLAVNGENLAEVLATREEGKSNAIDPLKIGYSLILKGLPRQFKTGSRPTLFEYEMPR